MSVLLNVTSIISFLELLTLETNLNLNLMQITKSLTAQRYFHTVICVNHNEIEFSPPWKWSFHQNKCAQLELPVVQVKGNFSFYLWPNYNRELLTFFNLLGIEEKDKYLLNTLWRTLKGNLKARLLLVASANASDEYLRGILKFCTANKAVNVIAVKPSANSSQLIYQPNIFPEFSVKTTRFQLTTKSQLYPNHVKNMQRFPIRVALTKAGNRAYVLKSVNGTTLLGGYVGHLITEFVRKYNATLVVPNVNELSDSVFHINYTEFAKNYDMSAEFYLDATMNFSNADIEFTHVYTNLALCLMTPIGKEVPASLFYVNIFDFSVVFLIILTSISVAIIINHIHRMDAIVGLEHILLNIYIFNGLLGQSFKMQSNFNGLRSYLYILVSLGGVIFNTSFVTYLQAFKTHPPTQRPIETFAQLKASDMQYAIFQEEYDTLRAYKSFEPYRNLGYILPTAREFYELRDNLDTRYLYPLSLQSWSLYNKQQQYLKQPLFRITDMCFILNKGMFLYLAADSAYTEALDATIDYVKQAGLVEHWTGLASYEIPHITGFNLRDLSGKAHYVPMTFKDLQLVLYVCAFMICVALLCFLGEIYWAQWSFRLF